MIQTTDNKPKSTREKIADLRTLHEEVFTRLGVPTARFIPKMAYKHSGDMIISFFPSEMEVQQDIYTEFVSREYVPEDPERKLYKWKYNPHYREEYETSEPHPETGHSRYLIPVAELIRVLIPVDEQEKQLDFELDAPKIHEVPIAQMTIRDFYAIVQNKPVSDREWLNQLIKNNK